eukprot:CAMPEP_0170564854 /NCGR_PEP_ID=MMETSP0211-20121228/75283_1 /TAXON_ID=311385 /ORGANISM="Pseudokeronopsis sp., Strain OXSARD2" /LENGTH=203 /DNA_ID=CAMNT_0010884857 /DNA_START=14 /DNA_END=625 /DNA_ORIENTATION=-
MAIARFYYGDKQGKFQSMKIGGILCLIVDRKAHTRFLRLYDINNSELLFQTELYLNFQDYYKVLSENFHCFPLEKVVVGIEFSDTSEASSFEKLIEKYSFKADNVPLLIKEESLKVGVQNLEIGRPTTFSKEEHAGWDPISQTFIINELPKDIKVMLKKAGFKRRDLKNKETALAIYEILLKEVNFENKEKPISQDHSMIRGK